MGPKWGRTEQAHKGNRMHVEFPLWRGGIGALTVRSESQAVSRGPGSARRTGMSLRSRRGRSE